MDLTEKKIFSKLKEIARRMFSLEQELLNNTSIGTGYYKILKALSLEDELNQTNISDVCQIDRPATSRLVEKMSKDNLVEKISKNGNKKNIYVKLTELGRKIINDLTQKAEKLKSKYFKELTPKDKISFLSLLNKI